MLETPCTRISVTLAQCAEMLTAARRAFPQECCGVLVGKFNGADTLELTRIVPAQNAAHSNRSERYVIDSLTMLNVERELSAAQGEFIAGFFHSHPTGANEPSHLDLDDALGVFDVTRRFYTYAIVTLQGEGSVRWWTLQSRAGNFIEIPKA